MWKLSLILLTLASACTNATPGSLEAFCHEMTGPIDQLSRDLEADGGDRSVISGITVINKFDAVCP